MKDSYILLLLAEVAIAVFAIQRARRKFSWIPATDINNAGGQAATFNFWFFFLNCAFGALMLLNIYLALAAAGLWWLRSKVKAAGEHDT